MYLQYGNYAHPAGEAAVTITKAVKYSERGVKESVIETWKISGAIIADGQYAVSAAVSAMQSAYNIGGQDLVLYHDDGTVSCHALLRSQATGGIRVTGFGFPTFQRGEFATGRKFEITVEGIFPYLGGGLLAFQETLSFMGGGGPRFAYIETIAGSPQRQQVNAQTLYRATQSGSAVGAGGYPTFPQPLFPNLEDSERRAISYTGGQLIGGVYTNYQVQWGYTFTSDTPLFALPNVT